VYRSGPPAEVAKASSDAANAVAACLYQIEHRIAAFALATLGRTTIEDGEEAAVSIDGWLFIIETKRLTKSPRLRMRHHTESVPVQGCPNRVGFDQVQVSGWWFRDEIHGVDAVLRDRVDLADSVARRVIHDANRRRFILSSGHRRTVFVDCNTNEA
jgi:hypothetical protein